MLWAWNNNTLTPRSHFNGSSCSGNDGNPSDGSAPTRVQQHGEQQSPENGNMCGSLRMQFHPTEISIDMEMQERHHFTICMPCLSECGTATGIDCTNLRLTMLPEMQTQFQPTWLLIVLQWTDRCRAAHRTRSSCWTTSKLMGMTVLAIFALMHRRLKAKFHHLKFPAAMERAPSPTLNPLPNSLLRTHMPFISKIVSPRGRTWGTEVTMDLDLLGQMVRYSI